MSIKRSQPPIIPIPKSVATYRISRDTALPCPYCSPTFKKWYYIEFGNWWVGMGLEACLFGGTDMGERAPTEL
ncbi:MAG: hypothetical protein ACRCT1_14490, partial [Microcoleaceae cyanobacterium]